jgi:transcriptional regulator with XRE-family HTH domain
MAGQDRAPKGSPRRAFGKMLRFYRERAGLSREALADLAHVSASTIISYETAWRVPVRSTVAAIDAVPELNTGGALIELWDEFEEGMTYQVFPAEVEDWAAMEAVATTLRWFEPLVVPGVLQTEDYMRTVFGTRFGFTKEEVDQRVAERRRRQEILSRDKPPGLWVILDEAVLRRPVGGRHVMLEETNRLIEAAGQPSIRIEVIPLNVGAHEGLYSGAFILADFNDAPSVACIDTSVNGRILRDHESKAELDLTWTTLRGEALPRGASLALLEEVAKSWSSAA